MNIDKKNHEGYSDPTVHEALTNIERKFSHYHDEIWEQKYIYSQYPSK